MVERDTREALLEAGVELFLQGYDFTGTNAILERASAPRGSFYHHFRDKQDFALAVAGHYYDRHLPLLDRVLTDGKRPPLTRLRRYFEKLREEYAKSGFVGGCLLGMLGQELADRDATAREALVDLFRRWQRRLAACLAEAQEAGDLHEDVDVDETAAYLIDGWEGALIQMKLQKSGAPLDRFLRVTFARVLRPSP